MPKKHEIKTASNLDHWRVIAAADRSTSISWTKKSGLSPLQPERGHVDPARRGMRAHLPGLRAQRAASEGVCR